MFYVLRVERKRGSIDFYYRKTREEIISLENQIHIAYPNATTNKYCSETCLNLNFTSFN